MAEDSGGRPPFEPTQEQRNMVETLAGYGLTQDKICKLLINPQTGKPIDEKTLRKHFEDEYDAGAAKADAAVLKSLYNQAVGADAIYDDEGRMIRKPVPAVPAVTIFATRARPGLKWSEKSEVNLNHGLQDTLATFLKEIDGKGSSLPGPA